MTTPLRRPEGRYDEPRRLPRQLVAVLATLLGILLLTATYAAYSRLAGDSTRASVLAYDVRGDSEVVIRLEVSYDPTEDARCEVVAYDRDHLTVGHQTVKIARGLPNPTRLSITVPTSGRAVAVDVIGCAP